MSNHAFLSFSVLKRGTFIVLWIQYVPKSIFHTFISIFCPNQIYFCGCIRYTELHHRGPCDNSAETPNKLRDRGQGGIKCIRLQYAMMSRQYAKWFPASSGNGTTTSGYHVLTPGKRSLPHMIPLM